MRNIKLLVKKIYCSWCSSLIKKELNKRGAKNIEIKLSSTDIQKISFRYEDGIKRRDLLNLLEKIGVELVSIQ